MNEDQKISPLPWSISWITAPGNAQAQIFGGTGNSMQYYQLGDDLSAGNIYVISIPSLGAMTIDFHMASNGNYVFLFNNTGPELILEPNYFPLEMGLVVDDMGAVYVNLGLSATGSNFLMDMTGMDTLLPVMLSMVVQNDSLVSDWNSGATSLLYQLGFPETCMSNMDPDCCKQYIDFINSITLPSKISPELAASMRIAIREKDFLKLHELNEVAGWNLACTSCKAGVVAFSALILVIVGAIIMTAAPEAVMVTSLSSLNIVQRFAAVIGYTAKQVARTAIAAVEASAQAGVMAITEDLCALMGPCDEAVEAPARIHLER